MSNKLKSRIKELKKGWNSLSFEDRCAFPAITLSTLAYHLSPHFGTGPEITKLMTVVCASPVLFPAMGKLARRAKIAIKNRNEIRHDLREKIATFLKNPKEIIKGKTKQFTDWFLERGKYSPGRD